VAQTEPKGHGFAPANLSRLEPPIEIETAPRPVASIIWLHGLGADGQDFVPVVSELDLPRAPALRFVFPHAPYRPVTLNGGYVMRAWYDIAITSHGFSQNPDHLRESEAIVRALIARENERGIPTPRIVLAGFSQGGAVVLHTGLRLSQPLAGILVLSAPVPQVAELMTEIDPANAAAPVFLAHGTADSLVPFSLAEKIRARLQQGGLPLEWHAYPMEHSVCPEELKDIARWLHRVLAPVITGSG
jgi:phospholipase/carboxylesterase